MFDTHARQLVKSCSEAYLGLIHTVQLATVSLFVFFHVASDD